LNIIFLCRWKLKDGLTASTVLPHIKALVALKLIQRVVLITFEDKSDVHDDCLGTVDLVHKKITWLPLFTSNYNVRILNQFGEYRKGYRFVTKIIKEAKIDLLIAHGAPAGAMAEKATKESGIPYLVSLFEPHADYMLDSGVWARYGLKYRMQKRWENLQMKNALGLMPVTEGYKSELLHKSISPNKVVVVPCSVETNSFKFSVQQRTDTRKALGWGNATIGIYVGKYGGLYYNEEAFQIYQQCFEVIPDFRLIILSPQPREEILLQLQHYSVNPDKVFISAVPHAEVPTYLSAADFAFATYKPGPSKKYLSPVKIGEYWANGLPVLLTKGVGDDSDIIKKEGGGALFNLEEKGSIEQALLQIQAILKDPTHRREIPKLAEKYRSPEKIQEAYEFFFNQREAR
jgi:glycosyltransferase involved in cell wall biosynthesis